jgi:hypothetical protein
MTNNTEVYTRLRVVYNELLEVLETITDINEALVALQRVSTRMNLR